mgnify:CR=1 FL=1
MFLLSQSAKIREAWQFFKRECVTLKAENGEIINSFTRLLNYIYKNMAQTINQRIDALRALLKREGIDAFIIPSTDPHLSEYVAPYWKSREWISGFTGSAGTVVITTDKAGLWTDSRYFSKPSSSWKAAASTYTRKCCPKRPASSISCGRTLQRIQL